MAVDTAPTCFLLEDDPPEQHGKPIACTQCWNALSELHRASQAENDRLRQLGIKQQDEIETLNGYADAVESLREIGKATGCGHVDDPDGRRQLVNCVTQTIDRLEMELQVSESFRSDYLTKLELMEAGGSGDADLWAVMKEQRDTAQTRATDLEGLLREACKVASFHGDLQRRIDAALSPTSGS